MRASAAHAASETRATGEFQAVVASGAFAVQLRQADKTQVELEGDPAALARIETVVEVGSDGPVLQIRQKSGSTGWSAAKQVIVRLATPRLTSVSLRGSGDLRVDSFQTPELRVSVSGSGDAYLKGLQTQQLGVAIAGSGDVHGQGRTQGLKLSIAGSGDARLRSLVADAVDVGIAGSGDAEVHAQNSLSVRIAGSGDVRFLGRPSLTSSVAGSGSVQSLR
jgi:Putative auto-transporter adhesin, head GIN domain